MVLSSHEWNPHIYQRTVLGVAIAGSVLFGSVAYSPQLPKWARLLSSMIALGNTAVGMVALKQIETLEPDRISAEEVEKELAIYRHLQRLPQPQTPPSLPQNQGAGETYGDWVEPGEIIGQELALFEWGLLRTRRNDFPHIGIAGKTGGGKSWLAEYLASLFDGVVVAIAPHWNKGDFTSADLVVGWGRDFGTITDGENLTFEEILSGQHKISACGFMAALIKEMDRRYQLTPDQVFVGENEPEIVVILDEFNAWATEDKNLPIITSRLLREARKVKIRLIPLVQGTEVEAMGCKGQGQLRDQITWVMISNRAKQYASINSRKAKPGTDEWQHWQLINQFLSVAKYPAFVGDLNPDLPALPAQIPDLSQWKKSQPSLAKLAGWDSVPSVQSERQNVQLNEPAERLNALPSFDLGKVERPERPYETWDGNGEIPPSWRAFTVQALRASMTKTDALENTLGLKRGGSKIYQSMSALFDELRGRV